MAIFVTGFLVLILGQAPNEPVYHNTFKHRISFNYIQPERRPEFREVRLYMSPDEGKSWQWYAAVAPDKNEFPFDAPKDGVYWFRIAAVDLKNKQQPEDIYKVPAKETI